MKQSTLLKLWEMDYDQFKSVMGTHVEHYMKSKWDAYHDNPASFLLNIDEELFNKFITWAETKD